MSKTKPVESALDLRRQVDVGSLRLCVQGQVFGVEFHASTFTTLEGAPSKLCLGGLVSSPNL